MVCLKQPDREAAVVCAACGKPLCAECVLHADGADYCSENCHRKGLEAGKRSVEVIRSSAESNKRAGKRALLWLIVIIIAAVAGWYFYQHNHKQIHKKVNQVTSSVREGANEAINAGKGAMPQDTKYKRDRESLVR